MYNQTQIFCYVIHRQNKLALIDSSPLDRYSTILGVIKVLNTAQRTALTCQFLKVDW